MTEKSKNALTETKMVNPVLDELDPQTFEVAAKKYSAMWKTEQYKDNEFRHDLNQTTNRIAQANLIDPEAENQMPKSTISYKLD